MQHELKLFEPRANEPIAPERQPSVGGASRHLPNGPESTTSEMRQGVRQLQELLEERLRTEPEPQPGLVEPDDGAGESQQKAEDARRPSRVPARIIKTALALAVAAVFGLLPLRTLLEATSVEAIVNSRVVTVRAPIEGEVQPTGAALTGDAVLSANEPLLRIVNVRADRSRLDSLQDRLDTLQIERSALKAKLDATQRAYDGLVQDVANFTAGRIRQLEARTAALASEIAAAEAKREVAAAAVKRALALSQNAITPAEVDRIVHDQTVAEQNAIAARRQLDAANVELNAARSGIFIGDSYNDRPSSAQRRDDLRQRLDEQNADIVAIDAETALLKGRIAEEAARFEELSNVVISIPVTGRVFEVMTAPGEQVRIGQDLLKVLDCSGAVVTANVTESVYNKLSIGQRARFRPNDGGGDLEGVVTNLTGLSEAPANLAIEPASLSRQAYRATVTVPALASGNGCAIGRTGRVIFGSTTPAGK
jgi:multidrug resistance efflux pump